MLTTSRLSFKREAGEKCIVRSFINYRCKGQPVQTQRGSDVLQFQPTRNLGARWVVSTTTDGKDPVPNVQMAVSSTVLLVKLY